MRPFGMIFSSLLMIPAFLNAENFPRTIIMIWIVVALINSCSKKPLEEEDVYPVCALVIAKNFNAAQEDPEKEKEAMEQIRNLIYLCYDGVHG